MGSSRSTTVCHKGVAACRATDLPCTRQKMGPEFPRFKLLFEFGWSELCGDWSICVPCHRGSRLILAVFPFAIKIIKGSCYFKSAAASQLRLLFSL